MKALCLKTEQIVEAIYDYDYKGNKRFNVDGKFYSDMVFGKRYTLLHQLTADNAEKASIIINLKNPEWGTKRFNYNEQALPEGRYCSTWGTGSNSAILHEDEYKFWAVVNWKR